MRLVIPAALAALTSLGAFAPAARAQEPAPAPAAEEGTLTWVHNWEEAAKQAKAKNTVVFVYVHRIEPH